ncbi:MAG: hypothetical protein K0Q76_4071 [Panacagrimonas sp.]|nr:hypothetical protein [Panacagrimonas sp.]MCC2658963.1 hypothetical protein [Panacagrimonas sp.]
MSESIRIRHCRLRVVRRGGWSWGADPKQLAERITRRLPALLAKLLTEQLAGMPPDARISKLTLRIPARLGEFYSLPASGDSDAAGDLSANAVMQRLRAAFRASLLQSLPELEAGDARAAKAAKAAAPSIAQSPTPVLDLLLRWRREKVLSGVLAAATPQELALWADAVLVEIEGVARRSPERWHVMADAVARLLSLRTRAGERPKQIVASLVRTVEAVAQVFPEVSNTACANAAPQSDTSAARMANTLAELRALTCLIAARRNAPARRRESSPSRRNERISVDSVLPFVVLGVLARSGYLAALGSTLATIGSLDQADAFGASVVYKLSPPPRRGWDREGQTARLVAAMCAADTPVGNDRMESFLRGLSTVRGPLDASLWVRSRAARSRSGVLVDRFEDGTWSVTEIVTGLPLGWFASPAEILRLVALLPRQSWWLAPAAADEALIAPLRDARARVVTSRLPGAGPDWLTVTPGWWTHDETLRRHAARLAAVTDDALVDQREHWQEFIERRPLLIRRSAAGRAAEASITLAVTTALGHIATELFGARERATPRLALQRFADLGGSVQVEEGRLVVHPALGRRFMDLNEHGLLRDVAGVPWLPGRYIAFAGP